MCFRVIVLTLVVFISASRSVRPQTPAAQTDIRTREELELTLAKASDEVAVSALLSRYSYLLSRDVWQIFINAASQKFYSEQFERCFFFYNVARLISVQLNEPKLLGITYYNIARSHSGLSDYAKARTAYLESEKAFSAAGSRRDLIYVWSDVGTLSLIEEDYELARSYSEKALELAEQMRTSTEAAALFPDEFGVAGALSTLGELSMREGESRRAIEYFQHSLALYMKMNSNRSHDYYIADVNASLGRAYTAVGDYSRGLAFLNKAVEFSKGLNRPQLVANLLNSIGFLYLEQEDYQQASAHFEKSLKIYQEAKNVREAARVLLNLGVTEQRQNNHEGALEYFRGSLRAAEATSLNDVMIAAREGIGVVLNAKGSTALAVTELESALRLAKESKDALRHAEVMWRMSQVYLKEEKFDEARALAISASQIAKSHRLLKLEYVAEISLGLIAKAQGKLDVAIETLRQAIAGIESSRALIAGTEEERGEFFEQRLVPYHALIEIYLKQGKTSDALVYAERAKGRVLLDAIANETPDLSKVLSTDEIAKMRNLNRRMSELTRQARDGNMLVQDKLDSSRVEYQALLNAVYVAHPELAPKIGLTLTLTAENLSSVLDNDTAYLEYVVFNGRVFVFVLRNDGASKLDVVELASSAEDLSRKANQFHERLAQRHPDYDDIAQDLYRLLIGPVVERIKGEKTLCIVPDDFLWNVPFQALMSRNNRYLIEDVAVYYAPSLSVLAQIHTRKATPNGVSLLAMGNPALSSDSREAELCPLPEAAEEVKGISSIFNGSKKTTLIGKQATEVAFKSLAPFFSVIHLATHGILDNRSPLYSYLMLSTTDDLDNDGTLDAREIMNMKIKADLVVLSACETANGRVAPGEGVIGMSWAFFISGARSVLVSQWKVNSASTLKYMTVFYESLKHYRNKALSIREAALAVMRKPRYSHPYYWAPFVLMGQN